MTHPNGDLMAGADARKGMPTWWERATGPHLLGLPVIAAYALIGIVPIVATIPAGDISAQNRLLWLGVAVVAQAGLSIITLIGGRVIGDRTTLMSRVARVGTVALAGAMRGVIVHAVADSLGLVDPTNPISRALNSSLTVLLWMGVLAILVDAQVEFRRSYRDAFTRDIAMTARVSDDDTWVQVDEQVREWSEPVQRRIEDIRSGYPTGTPPDRVVDQAADAIRELVATRLRPLSHRLWFAEAGQPPRVRIGPVAVEAISRGPILTPLVLVVLIVGMIIGSSVRYGIGVAVVGGISASVLAVVYALACRISLAHRSPRTWNLVTVPIFCILAGVVPTTVPEWLLGMGSDLPTILTISIGIATFGLIVAMAQVTSADRRELLDAMHDPQAMRAAIRRVREQEAATYLHNHVKSQLTASALRMREAARTEDPQAVREAADAAVEVLARPIPDAIVLGRQSPRERLVEIADSWSGIAQVDIDLPEELPDSLLLLIGDIAAEAIANAVRGGEASLIWLGVERTDTRLVLTIRDDGVGSDTEPSQAGMGTAWLDAMVPGLWQRESGPRGTVLTVALPGL